MLLVARQFGNKWKKEEFVLGRLSYSLTLMCIFCQHRTNYVSNSAAWVLRRGALFWQLCCVCVETLVADRWMNLMSWHTLTHTSWTGLYLAKSVSVEIMQLQHIERQMLDVVVVFEESFYDCKYCQEVNWLHRKFFGAKTDYYNRWWRLLRVLGV